MALETFQGTFTLNATTGNQTISFSPPVTFTPVAIEVWSTVVAAEGVADNSKLDYGAGVSSSARAAIANSGTNNVASGQHFKYHDNSKLGVAITTAGAVFTAFDLVSFASNEFTINVTTASAFQRIWHYKVYGGSDITNVTLKQFNYPGSGTQTAVTGVGFQADFIKFFTAGIQNAPASGNATIRLSIGVATRGNSPPDQHCIGGHTAVASAAAKIFRNARILALPAATAVEDDMQLDSIDSDGFTFTVNNDSGNTHYAWALCFKGGSYKVGTDTTPTSTGTRSISGLSFDPVDVFLMGAHTDTQSSVVLNIMDLGIGGADQSSHYGAVACSDNESNPSTAKNNHLTTRALSVITGATVQHQCTVSSWGTGAITLNWDTVTGVAEYYGYSLMGDTPTPLTRTVTENMSLATSESRRIAFGRSLSESIGISDSTSYIKASLRVVAEALGVSDLVSGLQLIFGLQINEALGISDAFTGPEQYPGHNRTLSDDMTIGHNFITIFKTTLWTAAVQEIIGLSDLAVVPFPISYGVTISEALGITDSVAAPIMLWRRLIRNTLGTADNVVRSTIAVRSIAELMGLATSAGRATISLRTVAENLAVTDSAILTRMFAIVLTSNLGLSDSATREATYQRLLQDMTALYDLATRQAINLRVVSESLGLTDSVSRALTALRLLSENLGIQTSASRSMDWGRTITEQLGFDDEVLRAATSLRALAETIGMADSPSVLTIWLRLLSDQFNLSTQVSTFTISDASGYVGADVEALESYVDGAEQLEADLDGAEAVQGV